MSSPSPIRTLILRTGNIMTSGSGLPRGAAAGSEKTSRGELLGSLKDVIRQRKEESEEDGKGTSSSGFRSWTYLDAKDGTLYVPSYPEDGSILGEKVEGEGESAGALSESRDQYDITAKLFHLSTSTVEARPEHVREAIRQVRNALGGLGKVDLVIVSFPGVVFDADDETAAATSNNDNKNSTHLPPPSKPDEETSTYLTTYRALESFHNEGIVASLGLSEFGTDRLTRLLPHTNVKPKVVQINVRDCCVVPRELIDYAKREGIVLLTHNDGAGEVVQKGDVEDVVGGLGALGVGLEGKEVVPMWVVKYTAVVRDRGVVEDKGYIVMAEVR